MALPEVPRDGEPGRSRVEGLATTDGRIPGERGRATRQRLLDATVELLTTTPWRSVKVIHIARRAGTSPATFYQYFGNVEGAIAVLAETIVEEAAELAQLVDGADWSPDASWPTALAVTQGFLEYWEENRAVFRVLGLATEADANLRGVQVRALNEVTVALAGLIAEQMPMPGHRLSGGCASTAGSEPMAVAGALVAMFANVAAHRYGFEFWGIRTADLVDSQARFLHWAVTGRPGPPPESRSNGRARRVPGPRTSPEPGGSVAPRRTGRRS